MKKISLFLFIILLIVSCDLFSEPTPQQVENERANYLIKCLPKNAIMIKYLGNNWCYFELDGKTFLYHKNSPNTSYTFESLTQVQE